MSQRRVKHPESSRNQPVQWVSECGVDDRPVGAGAVEEARQARFALDTIEIPASQVGYGPTWRQ